MYSAKLSLVSLINLVIAQSSVVTDTTTVLTTTTTTVASTTTPAATTTPSYYGKCYKANRTTTTTAAPTTTTTTTTTTTVAKTTTVPPKPTEAAAKKPEVKQPEPKKPDTPAPAPVTPKSSGGGSDYISDCLNAHNSYRAAKGVPPLAWSADLANKAQIWANRIEGTPLTLNSHSHVQGEGENISGAGGACSGAVRVFAAEAAIYRDGFKMGQGPNNVMVVGHYSQLMWRTTTHVGCASSKSRVVCKYVPPGNWPNVLAF
ncbi:CAP domain-containing protein [Globomyces pollinis-pini]|nr:CAP domain-containing protein [Globomyces pollinis-pini]